MVQAHADRDVWLNAPPLPLAMDEMDYVFDLPYARAPHPVYGKAKIPAWDMIRYSVNIMRGCFGGCTFCSITEHEGRIIQSRSEPSILREIELIRDKTKGFTGTISDLGGPLTGRLRVQHLCTVRRRPNKLDHNTSWTGWPWALSLRLPSGSDWWLGCEPARLCQ
jgi:radical SAM superfamily enzyme YgiQ (UPF0313 family)